METDEIMKTSTWLMGVLRKSTPIHTTTVPYGSPGTNDFILVKELTHEIDVPSFGVIARNIDYLTPDDLPLCNSAYNYQGKFYMVEKIIRIGNGILYNKYLIVSKEAGY